MNESMKAFKLLNSYHDTLSKEDFDKDETDFLLDAMDTLWGSFTEEERKELEPLVLDKQYA